MALSKPANPTIKKDSRAWNTEGSGACNSLFKVLCIFPLRYLFAIGLKKIFSLRCDIPPAWRSHPRERDSGNANITPHRLGVEQTVTILHTSFQKIYTHRVAHHTWWRFKTGAPLLWNMGLSFFIRHYCKNPISFLFHHLLICLNSEGNINHTGPLVSLTLAYKCTPECSRKPNRCSCE